MPARTDQRRGYKYCLTHWQVLFEDRGPADEPPRWSNRRAIGRDRGAALRGECWGIDLPFVLKMDHRVSSRPHARSRSTRRSRSKERTFRLVPHLDRNLSPFKARGLPTRMASSEVSCPAAWGELPRSQIINCRAQIGDYKLQIPDRRLQSAESKLQKSASEICHLKFEIPSSILGAKERIPCLMIRSE